MLGEAEIGRGDGREVEGGADREGDWEVEVGDQN